MTPLFSRFSLPFFLFLCTSPRSSFSSLSLDAGPHHADLLRVVDPDNESPLGSSVFARDDVYHDESLRNVASPLWTADASTASESRWIAVNRHHRFVPGDSALTARSGPFEASSRIAGDFTTELDDDDVNIRHGNASLTPASSSSSSSAGSVEVTAHPVAHALSLDEPVLRILFHATNRRRASCYDHLGQTEDCRFDEDVCVSARVKGGESDDVARPNNLFVPIEGNCVVESGGGKPTACLMQIVVPTNWWTTMAGSRTKKRAVDDSYLDNDEHRDSTKPERQPFVTVVYEAFYVDDRNSCAAVPSSSSSSSESRDPSLSILSADSLRIPMTWSDADSDAAPLESNDVVRTRTPFDTVYRGAIFHVPVTVDADADLDDFVVKAKVKRGLRIVGAEAPSNGGGGGGGRRWKTVIKSTTRGGSSIALVVSRRRRRPRTRKIAVGGGTGRSKRGQKRRSFENLKNRVVVATVIFEAADDKDFFIDDQVRVTWSIEYDGGSKRNTSQMVLHASHDSVQALVPVVKTRRLLNTALVDGNVVVEPMRVFAVSYTGVVQDISSKASCHSQSRDSLKVALSCDNVYLDGTETHGFSDVTVLAKYTHYLGYTTIAVWVPRLPLNIVTTDDKLSQIRGWKVPRGAEERQPPKSPSKITCSLKYQQATMLVLARFLTDGAAITSSTEDDHDDDEDGGVKWLLSHGSYLDVTPLVTTDVRAADPRVLRVSKDMSVDGLVLTGISPGNTLVRVISPFSGRILASAGVEVTSSERVDVIGTRVSVLTGLNLSAHERVQRREQNDLRTVVASLTEFHRFHALDQKGVLVIQLLFSDGTIFPLDAVSPADYSLVVNSLANDVVAIATPTSTPSPSWPWNERHVPTLIATGQGSGDYVYVSFDSPEICAGKRKQAVTGTIESLLMSQLTSDYIPITVGDGISADYDLALTDDWVGGNDDLDGYLNDGSFDGYGSHWGGPLGDDTIVRESTQNDPARAGSYAYQEFSKLGAVKESRERKKLFGNDVKRKKTFSPFSDYDFDRWDTRRIQDPQDFFLAGVSEKRAAATRVNQGVTKTEIALYVLLSILCIAVAILAAHCAMHYVRKQRVVVKVGRASSKGDDDCDSATEDASDDFARVDDFVWMSKEQLEDADIPVECTQRLMPEAEFVAQTLQRDLPPHHPGGPVIASLSRVNSRSSYSGRPGSHTGSHRSPGHGSLPIAAHHRGSLPECHHRSRTSSVASSSSRMSNRSTSSSSQHHHQKQQPQVGTTSSSKTVNDFAVVDDDPQQQQQQHILEDRNSLRSSNDGVTFAVDGSIRSHDGSLRSTHSQASSLLSVTLNPMDDHLAFERDHVEGGTIIPRRAGMTASPPPPPLPLKSSMSVPMTRNSPSTSPPSSPRLTGSPPASPLLTRSSRRLIKQDSVTSTSSKALGSICYDYKDRGISFDQMVQYFDHLDETPT